MISRRAFLGTAGAAIAFPAIAGTGNPARYSYRQVHMGMIARITLFARHETKAREAAKAAFARIADVDKALSHFNPRSEARQLTASTGTRTVSKILADNLVLADEMHRVSSGQFDASVGALSRVWRDARRAGEMPDSEAIKAATRTVGWADTMTINGDNANANRSGLILDFGGTGKGYALDLAADALLAHGIEAASIEIGGDVRLLAAPPGTHGWRISILRGGLQQIEMLSHCAVSTSGPDFQSLTNAGTTWSHVIDTGTGQALADHRRLSVIGGRGSDCDAAATIMAMMPPQEADMFRTSYFPEVQIYEG